MRAATSIPRHRTSALLAAALCAVGLPLFSGCGTPLPGTTYRYATGDESMLGQKTYHAEEFFSGRQLEVARAIEAGNMPLVRQWAQGTDLTAPGQRNMTLMWFAIIRYNYSAVKTLVELGVDPDTQVAKGLGSALDVALIPRKDSNNQSGIRLLQAMLDGGLSPNYKTPGQTPLLQRAAGPGGGVLTVVQLLIERGADINARDSIGNTALSKSITSMNLEIALYLVNRGADFSTNTTNGVSVTWAVYKELGRQAPGPVRTKVEQLRDLMIQKSAKWPPDPPEVVRDQMRTQGITPAVPWGKTR
jgi:hypothetical protein